MIITAKALPAIIGDKSIRIDFDTHVDMVKSSGKGVKDLLMHSVVKSGRALSGEKALENTRSLLNDDKHHFLIAPHVVSGLFHNFDNGAYTLKLAEQTKLQQKVSQHFGKDIGLECYKHFNTYPEYSVQNDKIVGEQKVQCSLYQRGFKFEPLFDIDVNLLFNIHPEVGKDGRTLKASFGDIQATSIAMHDRKLELETKVSDTLKQAVYKIQDKDSQKLMKITEIFSTPNIIDMEKLQASLLPAEFKLPLPPGLKFQNSNVKIHENGVLDINMDLSSN
jgi:hypothetical protein